MTRIVARWISIGLIGLAGFFAGEQAITSEEQQRIESYSVEIAAGVVGVGGLLLERLLKRKVKDA